jgi:hypothetical protein
VRAGRSKVKRIEVGREVKIVWEETGWAEFDTAVEI